MRNFLKSFLFLVLMVSAFFAGMQINNHPYHDKIHIVSKTNLINNQIGCKAISSASYFPTDKVKDGSLQEMKYNFSEGTDEVAIKINEDGKTLTMLTSASLKQGETEGFKCIITYKDESNISAVCLEKGLIETITLDKKTGIMIWTKNGPWIMTTVPRAFATLFTCI